MSLQAFLPLVPSKGSRPPAVKDQIKRLKGLWQHLGTMPQRPPRDAAETLRDEEEDLLRDIAHMLLHPTLLHNPKDKVIPALTACCLVEMLRLFAPEAPYDASQLQTVFTAFFQQCRYVTEMDSPLMQYSVHILSSLAAVRSVLCLFDASGAASLFTSLVQHCFGWIRAEQPEILRSALLHLLEATINEAEAVPHAVTQTLISALLDKTLLKYQLAVDTFRLTKERMRPVMTSFFADALLSEQRTKKPKKGKKKGAQRRTTSKKRRKQSMEELSLDSDESDLSDSASEDSRSLKSHNEEEEMSMDAQSVHTAFLTLYRLQAEILDLTLPYLQQHLLHEDASLRVLAVTTFGNLLSDVGSLLATEQPELFKHWLARFQDISPAVRISALQMLPRYFSHHANQVPQLENSMAARLQDVDDRVRHVAVTTVQQIVESGKAEVVDLLSTQLMQKVADRCVDKRPGIIHVAVRTLSVFWRDAFLQLDGDEMTTRFTWIPDTLCSVFALRHALVAHHALHTAFADVLLMDKSDENRARRLALFLAQCSPTSIHLFTLSLRMQKVGRDLLLKACLQPRPEDSGMSEKDDMQAITELSRMHPDAAFATKALRALAALRADSVPSRFAETLLAFFNPSPSPAATTLYDRYHTIAYILQEAKTMDGDVATFLEWAVYAFGHLLNRNLVSSMTKALLSYFQFDEEDAPKEALLLFFKDLLLSKDAKFASECASFVEPADLHDLANFTMEDGEEEKDRFSALQFLRWACLSLSPAITEILPSPFLAAIKTLSDCNLAFAKEKSILFCRLLPEEFDTLCQERVGELELPQPTTVYSDGWLWTLLYAQTHLRYAPSTLDHPKLFGWAQALMTWLMSYTGPVETATLQKHALKYMRKALLSLYERDVQAHLLDKESEDGLSPHHFPLHAHGLRTKALLKALWTTFNLESEGAAPLLVSTVCQMLHLAHLTDADRRTSAKMLRRLGQWMIALPLAEQREKLYKRMDLLLNSHPNQPLFRYHALLIYLVSQEQDLLRRQQSASRLTFTEERLRRFAKSAPKQCWRPEFCLPYFLDFLSDANGMTVDVENVAMMEVPLRFFVDTLLHAESISLLYWLAQKCKTIQSKDVALQEGNAKKSFSASKEPKHQHFWILAELLMMMLERISIERQWRIETFTSTLPKYYWDHFDVLPEKQQREHFMTKFLPVDYTLAGGRARSRTPLLAKPALKEPKRVAKERPSETIDDENINIENV